MQIYSEEQVNTFTAGTQDSPSVTVLADGSYVVAWVSYDQDGVNSYGIYAQRFSSSGIPMGPEFLVNSTVSGNQTDPSIAALADGGFVITWQDNSGADGSGDGIFSQRYDAAGEAVGAETLVTTVTTSGQNSAEVVAYDSGYAVVWTSYGNDDNTYNIYLQRFATDGTPIGVETLVSTIPSTSNPQTGSQYQPSVAAQANGDLLIAWNDSGSNDGSSDGVFARVFTASTATFGDTFLVNTTTANSQSSSGDGFGPSVAALTSGGSIVVWASYSQDGSTWGVFGQLLNVDGSKNGGEFLINESTNGGQYQPDVTALSTGGFVVTWYNDNYDVSGTGSTRDVYVREFDASGAALGGQTKLVSDSDSTEYQPSVADLGNGNYVVVYTDYDTTAAGGNDTYEIKQRLFGSAADLPRQDNPTVGDFTGTVTFAENLVNAAGQVIDPAISLTDLDSADFDGGGVELFYILGGEKTDQLSVRDQGSAPGQIGVSGASVTFGGVVIGTLSGGADGTNLHISLNANASVDAVEALIQNLTYGSTSQSPEASRTVALRVSDGDGGASAASSVTINVTLELDGQPEVHVTERVNTFAASTQEEPQIAVLNDGSYVIVWQSYGQDDTNSDGIYAQRFGANGVAMGPEFRVNDVTDGDQLQANVAALSDGGFVVTWQDVTGVDGSGYGVIAQRFAADGTTQGGNFVVNTTTSSTQYAGPVASYDGGFAIIWSDSNASSVSYDIFVQRFDNAGNKLGGEVLVSTALGLSTGQSGSQYYGDIAANAAGKMVVVWNDGASNDGNADGVFGRLYDAATNTFGATFLINTTTIAEQSNTAIGYEPRVSMAADGSFVVVWPANGQDGSGWGVFGQRFDASGAKLGGEFQINESTTSGQYMADVTVLSTGGFVVTWHNDSYGVSGVGSYQDVYIREYDAAGNPVDGERLVTGNNGTPSNQQYQPAVADLGNGNFVVAYSGYNSASDGGNNSYEIFQNLFGSAADLARQSANPVLTDLTASVSYFENDVNASPQLIDVAVSLTDTDSANFDGGRLEVYYIQYGEATDQLAVRNEGSAAGQVGVSGSLVSYGGIVIGSISGGTNGSNLGISFNSNATADAVEAVIQNLTYATTATNPDPLRTIAIRVSDGDGGLSEPSTVAINVTLDLDGAAAVHGEETVSAYAPNTLDDPQAAQLAGGGYVVVWASNAQDGSGWGVYGQVMGASGVPVGSEFFVNTGSTIGTQNWPHVAGLSDGSFVVTWQDNNSADGSGWSVQAQRFDAGGNAIGSNFTVNSQTSGTQYHDAVAAYGDGFVVVYSSAGNAGGASQDIYLKGYDNAGTVVTGETRVSVDATTGTAQSGAQYVPSVASHADGKMLISWTDTGGLDGNLNGVFARVYDAANGTFGATFQVNTYTTSYQGDNGGEYGPVVGVTNDGGYVVVWASSGQDGSSYGIYGQRFDASGARVGAEFQINESTSGNQYEPSVTGLDAGGFVVTWHNASYDLSGTGTSQDIYIREYDAAGNAIDGERKLESPTNSTEQSPAVADLGGGNYVVVYSDYNNIYDANDPGYGHYAIKQQMFGSATDLARSSAGPVIDDVASIVYFTNDAGDPRYSGSAQVIDNDVSISDLDSANFDGGSLLAQLLNGAAAGEALGIRDEGSGVGRIGLSGTNVTFGGTVIGTVSGNAAGSSVMEISLNANATAEAVQALLQNITYQNTAPASGTTDRYVGFRLFDGDGGASDVPNVQIRIQNSYAPSGITLTDLAPSLDITEGQAQAGVIVDGAVQLDYYNATGFDGGSLQVTYHSSTGRVDDQLSIRNAGAGSGEIGVAGSSITYGGTVIGAVDGTANGANGAALTITFNASATAEAIERLIESLSYQNVSDGPLASRTLNVRVYDAANVNTGTQYVVINIAPEADPAAAHPLLGEVQTNTYEAGQQQDSAVARLLGANNGGYVITWTSAGGQDGDGYGVFAQRYDGNGTAIGPEFQVNTQTLYNQDEPAVAGLQNGGFVVTWTDSSLDGDGDGIFAQVFNASGAKVGTDFQVNTSTQSSQNTSAVVGLSDGSFVVAYSSYYSTTTSSYYDVLAQRFAADGTALGAEFALNTQVSGTQSQPQLSALSGGGFVAIWADSAGDASGYGIVAQRFASDGGKVGSEIAVNATTTGTQQGPDVAGLPDGGFVAVWEYNNDIYAQRFDASGNKAGAELVVTTQDTRAYQNYARVDTLDDGGFVVTWDSYYGLSGSSYDIFAQKFDSAGNKIDGAFIVNSTVTGVQYEADVAALGGERFVISWSGYDQEQAGTVNTYGVFHQLFDTGGSVTRSDAPELLDLTTTVTFDEAVVNVAPQIIDPGVNLVDTDSTDFAGGALWVSVISGYGNILYAQLPEDIPAQDQLGIRNQGSAAGQIGISGSNVTYGGVVIGSITSSGTNGADLVVEFNGSATPTAVEALIENLTYANTSSAPVATRTISISVNDGAGGTSVPKMVEITVNPDYDGAQAIGSNEQVNTYEPNTQIEPAMAALADGGYVIVWTSVQASQFVSQDGWSDGVYGQRYDANGVPVGSEFQINSYTPNQQNTPAVAGLDGGGFVVMWQSSGQDGSGWGIYGQRFDANGTPSGDEFLVNTGVSNDQTDVDVASQPGGGFVATWHTYYDGTSYNQIMAQRFDAAGNKLGAELTVNTSTGFEGQNQYEQSIASFADGSFVIAWRADGAQDGNLSGVFAQRFASDGSRLGSEFQVNTYTDSYQYQPDVAVLTDGGFVVTWTSYTQDGSGTSGVFAQRYNADGSLNGAEFRVNTDPAGTQDQPSAAALSDGGFAIIWSDGNRAYVQQFDSNGERVDQVLRADTLDANANVDTPVVLGLANGGFVTAWRDYSYDTNSYNVYQQLFGKPGDFAHSANPELVDVASSVTFAENTINATPQLIDPGVGLFDSDSANFDGGLLEVNYITDYGSLDQLGGVGVDTQDQLGVRNQGSGTNQVGVSGNSVSFEGTVIGTIVSDGQNGAKLAVQFNADATVQAVERVIENLTYANSVSNPAASRTISIRVSDGDGGASDARTVQINVTPETDGVTPIGLERIVNTTTSGGQAEPSITHLSDGGYVVVWTDQSDADGNGYGVYGQRYDADDNPVGSEFLVNTVTTSQQHQPDVIGLSTGGFVVAWSSGAGQDGSGESIMAQMYAADGSAVGSEFVVNTTAQSTQQTPVIAATPDGGFIVAWHNAYYSSENSEYSDVFFQRYDASGTPLGAETQANPTGMGTTTQYQPDITVLGNGGFVVVWTDQSGADGNGAGVFGQVFDASGNALAGGDFQANSYITGAQDNAQVAALKGGGFVVVWDSEGEDLSSTGIYAQRFDDAGNALGAEFRVNTTVNSTQTDAAITGLENGGWVITWTDYFGASSGYDIFMQQYNAAGQPVDGEILVNTGTGSTQYRSAVTAMPDGGFVVAYQGYTYSGDQNGDGVPDGGSDSYDILMQRFGNTVPEIGDISVNGNEEQAVVLGYDRFNAAFNDLDGQTLQAIRITTLAAHGSIALNGVAVVAGQEIGLVDLQAGNLTYTGNTDFFGDDQFRWTASDGVSFTSTPAYGNITLNNVNDGPRLEAGADDAGAENQWFNHAITIGDPDPEGHLVTVNWGDGSADTSFSTSSANPNLSHYFADDGDYTVSVTVNDQTGNANSIETDTFKVSVANVAPTISISGANGATQGEVYTIDLGTPYDPGNDTVDEYRIDWGDGSVEEVYTPATLPTNGILTHTYTSTGSMTISVTLRDEDGTWPAAGSKTLTVAAPAEIITVNAGADIGVQEGNYFQKTITFDDPTDQGALGRTYSVDWGDGQTSSGNLSSAQNSFVIGHTYADDAANYTVTVVVDDEAQQGSDSFDVVVGNVVPTVSLIGSGSVPEGSAYVLTLGAINDPGNDTVQSYVIHWGDGTDETVAAVDLPASRQLAHTYADGLTTPTITVDLIDEDGTWLSAGSRSITVTNVAPTVALSGADEVSEASVYTLNIGAITDPGVDQVSAYQVSWGDGAVETFTAADILADASLEHVYADGGSGGTQRTISVTLVDEDGTHSNAGTKTITVNNVAPSLNIGGAGSIDEGDTFALAIAGSDVAGAADPLSYTIDWGDGSALQTLSAAELAALGGSVEHVFADDEDGLVNATARTITVTANDGDGGVTTQTHAVTVANVAPSIELSGADSVDEASSYTLSLGSLIDPGADTATGYSLDWGDGNVQSFSAAEFAALGGSIEHVYADGDASATITLTVTDEDGSFVAGTKTIAVNNVAPSLNIGGAGSIDEGDTFALAIAGSDVAGTADPLGYTIDWGDGSALQTLSAAELAALGGSVEHVFADDEDGPVNATARTITVTANDGDGGVTTQTHAVTVNNVAPSIALTGSGSVTLGASYILNLGSITDPGTDTVTSYVIDWGDGSTDTVASAGDVSHDYAAAGDYTVSVSLIDEDGTHSSAATQSVSVAADMPPEVVRIGDAPTRVSSSNPTAIADAWLDGAHVTGILHKADVTDTGEAWSNVDFGRTSPATLAGSDHYSGDLGVSGRTMETSRTVQEIDGTEALRFELDQGANKVTVDLARFYVSDDATVHAEAGRLQAFDANGNLVGEATFVADSSSGAKEISLLTNAEFVAVELSAGAYDGSDFVFGAYAGTTSGAAPAYTDGSGVMHGSDFLIDWVEFEFAATGIPAGANDHGGV
ncbi:PKD domain-containing protein [Cognatazoarcus halotolerans]|uniref:PKD domain-containing protein n=3 Tax=Cognatazoarcus halotolerans TaxID=2686016 RepID=UPI0013597F23|nr:PKD domain-containing protein [Cognatazoarcus halotolerans]